MFQNIFINPLYSSYSIVLASAWWSLAEIYQLCFTVFGQGIFEKDSTFLIGGCIPLYFPKSAWWILDCSGYIGIWDMGFNGMFF